MKINSNTLFKTTITVLTILFLTGCQKDAIISLGNNNQNKIIALQPLGEYNPQQLILIRNQLTLFFHTRVVILKPVHIPETFRSRDEEKYSADSLVNFLSKFTNDTIIEVIGLTHKDIYTMREHKIRLNNKPSVLHELRGIFGLGYLPGRSCVISDYRLISHEGERLNNRLRKVILHEVGHNLGLSHCSVNTCLMSEANGNITTLDETGGEYCFRCKRELK